MAAVLVALLVAVFTVTGGEIIRGKHYPIRSFPDKINGFPCPYHRPIAALEFGVSSGGGPGVKCLAENEILKHARLVDISERQWVHWAYKHDENYVFENFSWEKSTTPIQHDDSGYVLIEPHPGLLRMIKHHSHGLIFRTSGKDWRNEDHHTSRSTTPSASSPTWAPTTATPTPVSSSTVRSVTISYSSSSHQSSSRATSKQTTTDRLPTLFSTRDPLLPTTTSTPKLSTTTSTLITILVTTTVLGTCLGIVTIFKKYQRQRQVMAAAEENNIFLNPLFSEETEV